MAVRKRVANALQHSGWSNTELMASALASLEEPPQDQAVAYALASLDQEPLQDQAVAYALASLDQEPLQDRAVANALSSLRQALPLEQGGDGQCQLLVLPRLVASASS